jgi:hypothetical protein
MKVAHMRGHCDHYGGSYLEGHKVRHMNNTEAMEDGWLGNPHSIITASEDRRCAIAAYLRDFLTRIEEDAEFAAAVEGLRGQQVGCWCRGVSQSRTGSNFCHLDVVAAWIEGDLSPVYAYLRGEL